MDKIDIVKKVAGLIIGAGTTKIASDIISNNVAPQNLYYKISVAGAGVVIGMMAADATREYTGSKIDEFVAAVNQIKAKTA